MKAFTLLNPFMSRILANGGNRSLMAHVGLKLQTGIKQQTDSKFLHTSKNFGERGISSLHMTF
jgi:hypothetical protein